MHKLLKQIIIIFSMMFAFPFYIDAQTAIDFKCEDSDDDYIEIPDEIQRSVPQRMVGYVDWETKSIILPDEISESAVSFELWIDDTCQLQTIDESEFVVTLSGLKAQCVTIIILTANHKLTGIYIR